MTPSTNPNPLDDAIEAALRGEPTRPVPDGFAGRTAARLRVAAMIAEERKRYRAGLMMGAIGLVSAAVCLAGFAWLADLPGLMKHGVPGGRGAFDSLLTSVVIAWQHAGGSAGLAAIPVCALSGLVAVLSLRRWAQLTWRHDPSRYPKA